MNMSDLDKLSPYYRFIYKKLRNRYYRRLFKIPFGSPYDDKFISAKYHEVNKELRVNTAKIFELNERN